MGNDRPLATVSFLLAHTYMAEYLKRTFSYAGLHAQLRCLGERRGILFDHMHHASFGNYKNFRYFEYFCQSNHL